MMKTITKQELKEVLDKHQKWLHQEDGGERADLSRTVLRDADLACANLRGADLSGSNLRRAMLTNANLRYADLSCAVIRDAHLRGADFTEANLSHANFHDANIQNAIFTGANFGRKIPVIQDIHKKVYEAAIQRGALNMIDWHKCGTTHCWAGWVVHLAGKEGYALEDRLGPACAAAAIYEASDPGFTDREGVPDFYGNNGDTLADLNCLAEAA